jgi:Flp pilus assembly protein TadG
MIFSHHRSSSRRGVAAVELALLLPFITIMLLGVWEVGRLLEVNQILSNATREGARQASTGLLNNSQIQQVVKTYVQNAGLPTQNVTITVADLTNPGSDATSAAQLDQMRVSLTMPCSDVLYAPLYLVTNPSTQFNVQSVWYSVKDQTYPNSVSVPPGY